MSLNFRSGLIGLVMGVAIAVSTSAENLQQTLEWTSQSNPELLAQRAALKAQVEGVELAKAARRPKLNLQTSLSRSDSTDTIPFLKRDYVDNQVDTFSARVVASLLIWDGGQTPNAVAAAEASYRAAELSLEAFEQSVLLQAVSSYVRVLSAQDSLNLQLQNHDVAQSQLSSAQIAFDEGAATIVDVAGAQANLANVAASIAAAESELLQARQSYQSIVGREPGKLEALPLPKLPNSETAVVEAALRVSPSILAAIEGERSAQFDVRRVRSSRNPTISADASLSRSRDLETDTNNDTGQISITGSMPLYSGGQIPALERQALAVLEQRAEQTNQQRAQIRLSAASGWARYQAAIETRKAMEALVEAQKKSYEAAEVEFELGANTITDKLTANRDLVSARNNLNSARHNVVISAYNVLSLIGELRTAKPAAAAQPVTNDTVVTEAPKERSEAEEAVSNLIDRWKSK